MNTYTPAIQKTAPLGGRSSSRVRYVDVAKAKARIAELVVKHSDLLEQLAKV